MFAYASLPADLNKRAAELPEQYISMTANSEDEGRDPGLLVTRDDIIKIKRYERAALKLPVKLPDVVAMLGFDKTGIRGLEPEDLRVLYKSIHDHGLTWEKVEQQVKLGSADLNTFAQSFLITGNKLLDVVDAMDIIDQILTPIRDLVLDDITDMVPGPLSDKDKMIAVALVDLLAIIAVRIKQQLDMVEGVKAATASFARTITTHLIPEVDRKIDLSRSKGLEGKLEQLNKDIDELTKDIDQKKQEYDQLVKQALDGVNFMGPIGLVVLGGIFGAKAEKVRKERNTMIKLRDAKVAEVKVLGPLIEAVARLSGFLDNLDLSLKDAEVAANNLRDMWVMLHAWVDNSYKTLMSIDDSKSLMIFAVEFALVLQPWNDIQVTSKALNLEFIRAVNDWNNGVEA